MNIKQLKKYPLSLLFLIIALPLMVFILGQKTNLFTKADSSEAPQEIMVSNISDISFSVSWITGKATTGFIEYGTTENLGESAVDDRQGMSVDRNTHFVTLKKLKPDTKYYFKITSGTASYGQKNKPFEQKTGPVLSNTPIITTPIFGKVYNSENELPKEAILYLIPKNGTTLATPVEDGSWLLTVDNSRSLDLQNSLKFNEKELIDVFVEGGEEGTSDTQVILNPDIPQKQIILNKNKKTISFGDESKNQVFSKIEDLNGDGQVNAIDYALSILKKI